MRCRSVPTARSSRRPRSAPRRTTPTTSLSSVDGQSGHELHAVRQHDPAPRRLDLPADAGLLLRAHRPGDRQLHLGRLRRSRRRLDPAGLRRRHLDPRQRRGRHCGAAGQLRDLVHLLPHPDRHDQERGQPGLHAAHRQLPCRPDHGQPEVSEQRAALGRLAQRADQSRQVPAHRRLRFDPAQPLVQQAVLAEDRRHLAGARGPGPGRPALRRQDRRHQHRHAGGSRPVLVPAELHDHDDGRLLERQRRDRRRRSGADRRRDPRRPAGRQPRRDDDEHRRQHQRQRHAAADLGRRARRQARPHPQVERLHLLALRRVLLQDRDAAEPVDVADHDRDLADHAEHAAEPAEHLPDAP